MAKLCFTCIRQNIKWSLSHAHLYSFIVINYVILILRKEKYILGRIGIYFGGFGEKLNCFRALTFCLLLLPLWESVIVLCFVVRYFMSILVLQSSWWGRESWLLCLICLPFVLWWLSGSSSRCHGVVCNLWLWYFLIILICYFWGATANTFRERRKIFPLILFFFCLAFAMSLCASVYMRLVVTCWERADLLALVCGVSLWVCHFPIGILGQVWYLIVSIPDLWTLTYLYIFW